MKKSVLLFLVLTLVFSGCTVFRNPRPGEPDIEDKIENKLDRIEDNIENKLDPYDYDDDDFDDTDIEDDFFEDLGKSVEKINSLRGKITLTEWVNGPVYSFNDNDIWYGFSEYDMTDNSYTPKGRCNCLIMPLYKFIEAPSGVIDTDTLVKVSDSKPSRGYDDMEEMYYYEITHDEYKITVYTDQNGEISADSSATIVFGG